MKEVIPFHSVNPIRIVGVNGAVPFCSIIGEGKLIYTSGCNIILQNTKTQQQKILFTQRIEGDTHIITHHSTLYNQHLLAIAITETSTLTPTIIIVPLNTAIFSQDERAENKVFHLQYLEQYESIESLTFFEEGSLIGIISCFQQITNFAIIRVSNGTIFYRESFMKSKVLLNSVTLSKQSYMTILVQDKKNEARLCLIAADEIARKNYYSIPLQKHERILQYAFQACPDESSHLIALTDKGYLLIFKLNHFQIVLATRICIKIEQADEKQKKNQLCFSFNDSVMPMSMQVSNHKIVISYCDSKALQLVEYSTLNPSNYRQIVIKSILNSYPHIKSTHSIRISKDGCSLAALFLISSDKPESIHTTTPMTTKAITTPADIDMTQCFIPTYRQIEYIPRDHYIALQIDLLSNLIDHNEKQSSLSMTLSSCAGQAPVCKVEYCPHSNTMFVLFKNKTIKYYNLIPNCGPRGRTGFELDRLQLWTVSLSSQPHYIAAHPFNFSVILIYNQILKFHYYNCKQIFPAFLVTPIKNCRAASFSPLGDKLILTTGSSFIIMDSYTFRTLHHVALPNISHQKSALGCAQLAQSFEPKIINDFKFISNDSYIFLSGYNTLTEVVNTDKTTHFGFLQSDQKIMTAIQFDKVNKLTVVALSDMVLVLSKATINSNNRCEVISKIQVKATALLQASQLGVFFIGTGDGTLHMLRWPHFSQKDLYLQKSQKTFLFDEPIRSLHVPPSMTYLYAVSESGSLAICQFRIDEGQNISSKMKQKIIQLSDIPLVRVGHWLVSRVEEERKQRQLIKLRGQEADFANNHLNYGKEDGVIQQKNIHFKKNQFEATYMTQIKAYQAQLGLQQILQSISMVKDSLKFVKRQHEREKEELSSVLEENLTHTFSERRQLEKILEETRYELLIKKRSFKDDLKSELRFLNQDFKAQQKIISQKNDEGEIEQTQKRQVNEIEEEQMEKIKQQAIVQLRNKYEEERQNLFLNGQSILSKNRNTNITTHCLHDKMGQIQIQKEKLEYDLNKITSEQQFFIEKKSQLQKQLDSNVQNYNRLMKLSRQLEQKLEKERRQTRKFQYNMQELIAYVTTLEDRQKQIDSSSHKVNIQFVEQRQQNELLQQNIGQLKVKILKLKDKKKKVLDKSNLVRTQLSHSAKVVQRQLLTSEIDCVEKLKHNLKNKEALIKQNQLVMFFQEQKQSLDTSNKKALKWNQLKENFIGGFNRNLKKLKGQHLKLTYQYNDLFKVSQDYRTKIINLQQQIQITKNQIKQKIKPVVLKKKVDKHIPGFSFLQKPEPRNTNKQNIKSAVLKKGTCISLHCNTGKFITQS